MDEAEVDDSRGGPTSVAGAFCTGLIYVISILLIMVTFPLSLLVTIRMVQVIIRLNSSDDRNEDLDTLARKCTEATSLKSLINTVTTLGAV